MINIMDEFNFDDNNNIGTSVSKLKSNIKNNDELFVLIKDLEDRLDNIELSNNTSESLLINTDSIKQDDQNPIKQKKSKSIKQTKINYQEIIIYMVIFILLNTKMIIEFIYKIPHLTSINSPYPNLIIRGLIFGLVIYLYKKFIK